MVEPAAPTVPPPAPPAPAGGTPPAQPPAAPPGAPPAAPAGAPPAADPKTLLGADPAAPVVPEPKKDDKPVVPEKYDLKVPDGVKLAAPMLEKIAAFARERGFSQEQAQALVEHQAGTVKAYVDGEVAGFKKLAFEEWPKQAEAHPDLGGGDPAKFKESIMLADRAFTKFATPEMKAICKAEGWANHPEFIRSWKNVGKAMGEDKFITAPPAPVGKDPEAWRKTLYDATPEGQA